MAVQAQWHTLDWGYSPERIISIESLDTGKSVTVERNQDKEGEPATQTVALDLQKLSFSYTAMAAAGCDPRNEYGNAKACVGVHAPFYLGGSRFLCDEMLLMSAKASDWALDSRGRVTSVTISLEFEEYAEDASGLKTQKGASISLQPGIATPTASSALSVGPSASQKSSRTPKNPQMQGW